MLAKLFLTIVAGLVVSILIEAMGQKQLAKLTFLIMVLMSINILAPKLNEFVLKWQDTGRKVENLTKKIDKLEKKKTDFENKYDKIINFGAPN